MIIVLINRLIRNPKPHWRLGRMAVLALLLNLLFGTGFYFAERNVQEGLSYVDSLWWAMVTMTTVGYGDYFAQTATGRFLISYPTFILGIGILGYMLGTIAEAIIAGTSRKKKGLLPVMKKNHVLICNAADSEKVLSILSELRASPEFADRPIVLVSDHFEELPDELMHQQVEFVRGLPTQLNVLERANIREAFGAIVLSDQPGNRRGDATTFAIGAVIEHVEKEIGRSIRVVCELAGAQSRNMMATAGTDGLVVHEGVTDCLLVQEFFHPGINEIFRQIITHSIGSQFYILPTQLEGRKLREIQIAVLEHPANLQIIGIIQDGKYLLNPDKGLTIQRGDRLILLADKPADFQLIETEILKSA